MLRNSAAVVPGNNRLFDAFWGLIGTVRLSFLLSHFYKNSDTCLADRFAHLANDGDGWRGSQGGKGAGYSSKERLKTGVVRCL